MKAAGAPSARRSHSMTLNDAPAESRAKGVAVDSGQRYYDPASQQQHLGSSHSDYGGRERWDVARICAISRVRSHSEEENLIFFFCLKEVSVEYGVWAREECNIRVSWLHFH